MPAPRRKQIVILFAGMNGFVDNYPVNVLWPATRKELFAFLEARRPDDPHRQRPVPTATSTAAVIRCQSGLKGVRQGVRGERRKSAAKGKTSRAVAPKRSGSGSSPSEHQEDHLGHEAGRPAETAPA